VAGIAAYDATLIDPIAQANIAKALIRCETRAGGPYTTWLLSTNHESWRDVDVAVNANIGYMLKVLGVRTPALESYITRCIVDGAYTSPYYIGNIPALYFIARWYKGSAKGRLIVIIGRELTRHHSMPHRAMLITAALRLGVANMIQPRLIDELINSQNGAGWPASALYFEPPQRNTARYAGSPELSTAFVIEALHAYQEYVNSKNRSAADVPPALSATHQASRSKIALADRHEITRMAHVIAKAYGIRLQPGIRSKLNRANVDGWVAYTLYDAILDGDESLKYLGAANQAMRSSLAHFRQALPQNNEFIAFVESAFTRMDAANTWEITRARDPEHLPSFGNLAQLANRSWGQVIAPTAVMMAAGYRLNSPEVLNLHHFFRHYIIAKQLSDDAHDWQEDLEHSRVTAVLSMLLKDFPDDDAQARQRYFWEHTVGGVNRRIRYHLRQAEYYLNSSQALKEPVQLMLWLQVIERSCVRTEAGKEAALEFIREFTTESLIK